MGGLLSGLLSGGPMAVGSAIAAAGALGTASFGLVEVLKNIDRGPANQGFRFIEKAVEPFRSALALGAGADWRETLRSHWINGVATDDQKAKAKSLIRLGMTPANAAALADALDGRLDKAAFVLAITNMTGGAALSPADLNALGRFDAIVSAALDAGYERADQSYRTATQGLAFLIAVLLAVAAGWLVDLQPPAAAFWPGDFFLAILVGLVATPLAPVASNLASALSTAASAFKAAKG